MTAETAALDGHAPAGPAAAGYTPRHRLDPDALDLITAQARQARPGRAALTVIGSVLFAAGWLIAKAFAVLFLSAAWCFAAGRMGWRQARGVPLDQPDTARVLAENEQLRAALRRLGG